MVEIESRKDQKPKINENIKKWVELETRAWEIIKKIILKEDIRGIDRKNIKRIEC